MPRLQALMTLQRIATMQPGAREGASVAEGQPGEATELIAFQGRQLTRKIIAQLQQLPRA